MKVNRVFFPVIAILLTIVSCSSPVSPKPRGYFRIDLPEKNYVLFDTVVPYTFEYPVYASISSDPYSPEEPNWINIQYHPFQATLHLSYKVVDGNLDEYLEDMHKMVSKHIAKADAIYDFPVHLPENKVYGLIYELEGSGTASPVQFFLTDSVTGFVRGALYFNVVPNNDSLAPVISFISEDIRHMIRTFSWKDN